MTAKFSDNIWFPDSEFTSKFGYLVTRPTRVVTVLWQRADTVPRKECLKRSFLPFKRIWRENLKQNCLYLIVYCYYINQKY